MILSGISLLSPLGVTADTIANSLPAASDLRADAASAARNGVPLIVLVSLPGCPHCEVVRRSHLLPLMRDVGAGSVIRQVELRGGAALVDFSGSRISHADFARRHGANIAPVVLFLDEAGNNLSAPLVGSMIPDFYGGYFDAALLEARAKLAARRTRAAGAERISP